MRTDNVQPDPVLERARLARDPRFDGLFYVGVLTTGIYCRPVCPAKPPKSENVRFFGTAAAAGEAGFRPCLRCRPESAPGSPAWAGTSATVRRGLRLIAQGALDQGDVEELADRLGVTSRHLRRLFARHIGASPLSVAQTQRLHFAKRLIDDTSLAFGDIAAAAGYGSVRRFNDAFRRTYGRSPRELRRLNEARAEGVGRATLSVRLACRQPFDWDRFLRFLGPRLVPGVEAIEDGRYLRTIAGDGSPDVVEVAPHEQPGYLLLTMHDVDTARIFGIVERARAAFDLDAPVAEIARTLGRDPLLEPLVEKSPGVRVPGAWDGFELAVRAVLGQQVSVKAATTLAGRIVRRYGEPLGDAAVGSGLVTHRFPTPGRLARARFNDLGIVRSRAQTLRRLAAATASGDLDFDAAADPADMGKRLRSIKGIGAWTAEYVAMRALKHPDAFPDSDLGLLKSLEPGRRATPLELAERAERWRPWRAYAAMLLWSRAAGSGG